MRHYYKKILPFILLIILSIGIKAQSNTSKSKILDRSILSLRLVKGFSTAHNDKQSSNINNLYSTGFQVKYLYLFNDKFAISTEPIIHNKGYTNGSNKVNITYLDIPINFERVKVKSLITPYDLVTVGLGFYGGFALLGKSENSNGGGTQNVMLGNAKTDERTRLDYGINFSTALCLGTAIEFGFNAQLGLNNVLPKEMQVNGNKTTLTSMGLFVGVNSNILKIFKK